MLFNEPKMIIVCCP